MKIRLKQLRAAGFTQRKPKEPGIYFFANEHELADFANPQRLREGWDVASIYWRNAACYSAFDAASEKGVWYIEALSGSNFAWRKGMWIKGPIHAMT